MSRHPLTGAQEGLWVAQKLDSDNPSQNTARIITLEGALDVDRFLAAADRALGEADGLAMRISEIDGSARIVRDGVPAPAVEYVDARHAPDPEGTARRWIDADRAVPRDPARDPMVTARLFRVAERRYLWYQCVQHLAVDWYGTALLDNRALDLYRSEVGSTKPGTAPFAAFDGLLAEEEAYRASERRDADSAFWKAYLEGMSPVRGLAKGVPLAAEHQLRERVLLAPEIMAGLQRLAGRALTGWPDAAIALVGAYLARHVAETEVVVGVPIMNRLGSAAANVPATVMNVVPLRVPVDEEQDLASFVEDMAEALRSVRRHARYRGESIRRDLGLLGEERRLYGPLVNVLPPQALPDIPGVSMHVEVLNAGPVDDMTFAFRGDAERQVMILEVEANPRLYDSRDVRDHALRLAGFLQRASGAGKLSEVPTMDEGETRRWISEVNDTSHAVEKTTLVSLFERAFEARGDATAVQGEDAALSYLELDAVTHRIASGLRDHGVGPGSIVGVLLPRSVEQVAVFIGVMRAGAAYLPVDPEHPEARTRQLLELAEPDAVITRPGRSGLVPDGVSVLDPAALTAETGGSPIGPPPGPESPAYVIFTSGSTGTPKGVVVEHDAIVNRLLWMREAFDFGPDDRILQKTPATFDVSVWELFLPFLSGATLVVAPPGAHRDPGRLARLVADQRITAMHFVPSMLGPFLDDPSTEGLQVPRVFVSGEALPAALRDRFHARLKGGLHNLYGPTEAAVDVTHWPAGPDDDSDPVPIGRPVWNTRIYVLDARSRPCPPGVMGELWIAGRQLARGYLGRPDLTRERFVEDPWGDEGDRMYRTGDLAAWSREGALIFGGRTDHQVKLRGQRIELGEVESVLRGLREVGDACVIVREDQPGAERLTAYVTAGAEVPSEEGLRRQLAQRLPEVMVPADVVVLRSLPVTANGKLDRGRLPRPEGRAVGEVPLSGALECAVAEAFGEVLGIEEELGADADFFHLGGHSLMAVRLARLLEDRVGVRPGLGTLFRNPTVGRLAEELRILGRDRSAGSDQGLEPVLNLLPQEEGGKVLPPLYCVHPAGGIGWCYGALARALHPSRPVFALQADGLDPKAELPSTLSEMARRYVSRVLDVHPGGPVHLAGWSVGGIIAHEMACVLRELGHEVGVVCMLDAYPADRWREEPEPTEADALRALMLIAGVDPDEDAANGLTRDAVRERLEAREHPLATLSDEGLDGVMRVVEGNARVVRLHRHGKFDGAVLHFRAGLDHGDEPELTGGLWKSYARVVEEHVVQALHPQMTGPRISGEVAEVLGVRLCEAEVEEVRS